MKKFVSLPVVDSSLYMFGGHMRTVPGEWSFFEQKHQAFELMCIVAGQQTTEIKDASTFTYGPGSVLIISPGTLHTNWNASATEPMTYITFHFNIESLTLKSEIISTLANAVIPAASPIAKLAMKTSQQMVAYSDDPALGKEQTNIKIQIELLNFLYGLMENINVYKTKNAKYSERAKQRLAARWPPSSKTISIRKKYGSFRLVISARNSASVPATVTVRLRRSTASPHCILLRNRSTEKQSCY